MPDFDAVIVGSGPNGLVAAALLTESGQRVLVLEAADAVGGGLRSEALTLPGFTHDVCASVHPFALSSPAFRELNLGREGLAFAHGDVPLAHPLDDAPAALLHRSLDETAHELGRDARAWRALVGTVANGGNLVPDAILAIRPTLFALPRLAAFGATAPLPATLVGRTAFRTSAARALFAGIAAHAIRDLSAPGTSGFATLLAAIGHHVGWPVAVGGSQRIADALVSRIRLHGGEVHTGHRVDDLADLPSATATVLDVTPREIVRIGQRRLPTPYLQRLRRYRYGAGVYKVDWALDGPVPWHDQRVRGAVTVHLGGTAENISASEHAVARGRHPQRPYVIFVQATVADPSRAPEGKHTGWAYCHVPNGSTVDMSEAIESQVERHAPGFRELILARHTTSTAQFESRNANYVGGDIASGVQTLRQLIARPVASLRPWVTPTPGIYLCSAATPPGPGVHGMGGWHAARAVMR